MSGPQTPEPTLSVQGDSPMGTRDEDAADGIQHSHRMLSFSDALLSIIATVMILPVTHTEISPEQFDKSIQKLLATRIAVYLMTFLIVTVAWAAHTRLFQVVGKIDDTLALLNLACMMTITFLPFTVSTCGGLPGDTLGPGASSAGAFSPAGRPQARARSCKEEKSSRGAAPGFPGWLRRGGLQGSRGARSGGDTCRRPHSGLTAMAWACCAAGSIGLRLPGCGTWSCFVLVFAVFLNGDIPRRASGHLPVLHVCDRHRGRAGADRGVRLPLSLPPEPPDRARAPQGPLPAAHPAHRPQGPGAVLPGRRLLLVLLPLVIPADGDGHLPPLRQQGVQLVQRQARGPAPPPGTPTGPQEPPAHSVEFFTFDLHEPLSKERVEAFSDGVYAIVATLLILDICEDNVPDSKDVRDKFHGSLVAALSAYGPHFLAYFGSFATVGLLWFAHHSLFLHIRKATQSMGLLNTLSLAFVGGLPLAYQQTSAFARQPRDELESVRVSCAIIFFASIFQFAIWTTALLQERETLQPCARFGGREHAFMFAKLALYPCASLLAFASTCFLSRVSTAIFHLTQIAVPLTFLLLRLLVRLASALLRALRGLARPAPGAEEDVRAPLLPSTC
nr:endosomal/lysosomal potassium channel TMEM175 isoform X1 [Vulpes vulpes]